MTALHQMDHFRLTFGPLTFTLQIISPDTVLQVSKGWADITAIRNYEKVCGSTLFQK